MALENYKNNQILSLSLFIHHFFLFFQLLNATLRYERQIIFLYLFASTYTKIEGRERESIKNQLSLILPSYFSRITCVCVCVCVCVCWSVKRLVMDIVRFSSYLRISSTEHFFFSQIFDFNLYALINLLYQKKDFFSIWIFV